MSKCRQMIVAVDSSETSETAFWWALRHLVHPSDEHVLFIHAAPLSDQEQFPNVDLPSEYIAQPISSGGAMKAEENLIMQESKALVKKFMEHCTEAGISCEGEVVKGDPGSWIVDEAKRVSANLVVVGSNDKGILERTFIGSISNYILHNCPCSIAIVRGQAIGRMGSSDLPRKIVIAVDESKEAVYAFTWAIDHFCRAKDKVIIYHVYHHVSLHIAAAGADVEEVYAPPDSNDDEQVQALNQSEKLVEEFMASAQSQKTEILCEGMVVTGSTEAKVCEGLEALKADVVIVGSRDRGLLARTFLGSVSDYLSYHSPCPLIAVKMPKQDDSGVFDGDDHKHAS